MSLESRFDGIPRGDVGGVIPLSPEAFSGLHRGDRISVHGYRCAVKRVVAPRNEGGLERCFIEPLDEMPPQIENQIYVTANDVDGLISSIERPLFSEKVTPDYKDVVDLVEGQEIVIDEKPHRVIRYYLDEQALFLYIDAMPLTGRQRRLMWLIRMPDFKTALRANQDGWEDDDEQAA